MTTERKVDGWIDDIVGALCDPIIVMPGGWGEDLPDWLRKRVTLERLCENLLALKENREPTATDAEAACYLFTASLSCTDRKRLDTDLPVRCRRRDEG